MTTRLAVIAVLLAGCATDVTSNEGPSIDLDGPALDESGVGGKADGTGQVVFLNFGGARLHGGHDCSDAPNNCSSMVVGEQDFAPFTVSDQWDRPKVVAAVTRCVSQFFADTNIRFVTSRPHSGSYTMMMIGAIYPQQIGFETGGPYGRAPVDCGNSNKNDIGFLLLQDDVDPDFYYMCRSIAHEIGHSFGMVHTTGTSPIVGDRVDVMCESRECMEAAASGAARWDTINHSFPTEVAACGGGHTQNMYARLLATLGVAPH